MDGGGVCPSPRRGPRVQLPYPFGVCVEGPGGSLSENSLQPYSKLPLPQVSAE